MKTRKRETTSHVLTKERKPERRKRGIKKAKNVA